MRGAYHTSTAAFTQNTTKAQKTTSRGGGAKIRLRRQPTYRTTQSKPRNIKAKEIILELINIILSHPLDGRGDHIGREVNPHDLAPPRLHLGGEDPVAAPHIQNAFSPPIALRTQGYVCDVQGGCREGVEIWGGRGGGCEMGKNVHGICR